MNKVMSLSDAIRKYVRNGQKIYLGGFSHCVPYSAGHEIIRQGFKNIELCKMVPEIIVEQMILSNTCSKLVFSWAGNPGIGNLNILRKSVEKAMPYRLELEEYTHYSLLLRLQAGANGLPFMVMRSDFGDLPSFNNKLRTVKCPYTKEILATVPAYNPDLAIIHAQRADMEGNVQMWGIIGENKEAAFAANNIIVTVEEIVDHAVIKSDPNRTIIPGFMVDAVVEEPWGAHPSYVHSYYDRDDDYYIAWNTLSRDIAKAKSYIDEWILGVKNRREYMQKLGNIKHLERGCLND